MKKPISNNFFIELIMAKKRKKKFSRTKQRSKKKIRAAIDKIKQGLVSNGITAKMAISHLERFGGDVPAPDDIMHGSAVRYSILSNKAEVTLYSHIRADSIPRVMHLNLSKITPKGETDMNDTLRAAMENDGNPPDEIAVVAKKGDEENVKSQLEQMVADMNEEARGDSTRQQYTIEQDGAAQSNRQKQLNLKFKLVPIAPDAPALSAVMSSDELQESLDKDGGPLRKGSREYINMIVALDKYHAQLEGSTRDLGSIDDIPERLQQARNRKNELLVAARAYLRIHSGNKDNKKNAAERLIEQVGQFQPNSLLERPFRQFVNDLPPTEDNHQAIERIEQQLIETPGGSLLTVGMHEMFFRKKTEILEQVIESAIQDTAHQGLRFLKELGRENYWKLLIDGKVHANNDKHFYDLSKGFMASMMKGLRMIVSNIDVPLDTDLIIALHTAATTLVTNDQILVERKVGVPDRPYTAEENWASVTLGKSNFQEQGIKKAANTWGETRDSSADGRAELQALRAELDEKVAGGYFIEDPLRLPGIDRAIAWRAGNNQHGDQLQATVLALMNHVIGKAYREIKAAKDAGDRDGIIGAIIDCCRGLGIIHPFRDANGRLIMFLALNKMLMEQGMSPTILEDQGLMIGKSRAELIDLIKAGQQ